MNMQPFSAPDPGTTASIAATTTTGNTFLDGTGNQVLVMNAGSQGCYVAFGDAAVEATASDLFIAGNASRVFTIPVSSTFAAAKTPTGTTTILFARGSGA
jgi:hypothetical protein